MKKSKIILSLAFCTLLLTGCGNKESKLVCTQTSSGVDVGFNVGFKGNTIDTMDLSYDMDLSKYSDTQVTAIGKQDFCTRIKSSMTQIKDAFSDCNQEITDKKLHVSAKLDIDKVSKNFLDKKTTPKAAKKSLEDVGYTCTIK